MSELSPVSSAQPALRSDGLVRAALLLASVAALAFAGNLLALCNLGYDFTDQGFYLNIIARPQDFPVALSQFGYAYHPLFEMLGRDVANLRRANLSISFILGAVATLALLHRISHEEPRSGSVWNRYAIGLAMAGGGASMLSLSFLNAMWLPTPSYNSLTFQALALTAIGFCLAEKETTLASWCGWCLIGIGGFLAFLGKPTSAALLAAIILVGLGIDGRLLWRRLIITVLIAAGLLVTTARFIGGSISLFFEGMQSAATNAAFLSAGHTVEGIVRLDRFDLDATGWLIFVLTATAVLVISAGLHARAPTARAAAALMSIGAAIVAAALVMDVINIPSSPDRPLGLLWFAWPAAAGVGGFVLARPRGLVRLRRRLSLVFVLVSLPAAYAFGTTVNYWLSASNAGLFMLLTSFACLAAPSLGPNWNCKLAPPAIAGLILATLLTQQSLQHPYRDNEPLRASTSPVQIAGGPSTVFVNREFAFYIQSVQRIAGVGGFERGMPMVDLTGHYPGTLFALGAKPLGAPWLVGGYPGSSILAAKMLDQTSCANLAQSWILVERDGPRQLPATILKRYGIDVLRDYDSVGSFDSPKGDYPNSYRQDILKPRRPLTEGLLACNSAAPLSNP